MENSSSPLVDGGKRRQRVQSAETGMTILKALARLGGAASLTAIAAEAGENAAKVHRYLSSLTSEGLVAQHPSTQHYHLGPEAVRIGLAALRQCDSQDNMLSKGVCVVRARHQHCGSNWGKVPECPMSNRNNDPYSN